MGDVIIHDFVEQNLRKLKKNKNADCCNCMLAEKVQLLDGTEAYVCNASLYDIKTLACFTPATKEKGLYKKSEYEILKTAIQTYGEQQQEKVAIEECSELIQAICHKHRGRVHNIAEEIADVEIMLMQLKLINKCAIDVAVIRQHKIKRLEKHLLKNQSEADTK